MNYTIWINNFSIKQAWLWSGSVREEKGIIVEFGRGSDRVQLVLP